MLNLYKLDVEIGKVDISNMILNMSILETIDGGVRGSFIVKDNINFYDTFIGHIQPEIKIKIKYLGTSCFNTFIGDGISDMKITKLGKEYTIHFISWPTMNLSIAQLCQVYSGTSDEILTKLWLEANGRTLPLSIDTRAVTKGKYVVPNINAAKAISNVVENAYDENYSAFCLYQRLWEGGITRFQSLYDMDKNHFYTEELLGTYTHTTKFVIENSLIASDNNLSSLNTVGTSNQIVLEDMNRSYSKKLGLGYYGKKISQIKLDKSEITNLEAKEITDIHATGYKISQSLYDNDEKSLFSDIVDPACQSAKNQKNRMYNQFLRVRDMISVPFLGVGFSVEVDTGGSNISRSRMDNRYVVAQLNHKFILNDGKMQYGQDLGLIRE